MGTRGRKDDGGGEGESVCCYGARPLGRQAQQVGLTGRTEEEARLQTAGVDLAAQSRGWTDTMTARQAGRTDERGERRRGGAARQEAASLTSSTAERCT